MIQHITYLLAKEGIKIHSSTEVYVKLTKMYVQSLYHKNIVFSICVIEEAIMSIIQYGKDRNLHPVCIIITQG